MDARRTPADADGLAVGAATAALGGLSNAAADADAPTSSGRLAGLGEAAGAHRRGAVGHGTGHARAAAAVAGAAEGADAAQGARGATAARTDDPTTRPDAAPVTAVSAAASTTSAAPTTTPGTDAVAASGATAPASSGAAGPEAPAAPVAEATLRAPFDGVEFAPAFGSQIAHFALDGVEHARVHLNPAEMGPIAMQLSMDGTQVRVELVADQSATRQALEQSLPALAGALREAGFTLAGGGVFQQARDGAEGRADDGSSRRSGRAAAEGAGEALAGPARTPARPRGLVDLVA